MYVFFPPMLVCPSCDDAVEMERISKTDHICPCCGYTESR